MYLKKNGYIRNISVIQLSDRVYNVTLYTLSDSWITYNITNLGCYTYFHWFFNPECQHIFGKQTGYIFQSSKRLKHGRQNITLHWINGIIRNNKCILTKLSPVFIIKTAAWTKNITTVNSVTNTWSIQQTPSPMFHGCTIANKQSVEPWKLSTSWGHTKVLFTCC